MKQLKDYAHYYKNVPIVIIENSTTIEGEKIKTSAILEGVDWHLDKPIAERVSWDWENIKLILRPLSDFNAEDFKHIVKILLNNDEILFAETDEMWIASSKEEPEEDELEMSDVERIYFAEECNYDNVISMDIKGERSFAYGCSEDCRFFIGQKEQATIFKEMLKMNFDVFDLIQDGLAIKK